MTITEALPGLVYGKPTRCPKCHVNARFSKVTEATDNDRWTCGVCAAQIRIGNYLLPVDERFRCRVTA